MELYFAYGSNLWIGQMRQRCPSTRIEGIATLPAYRLWFPVRSERWGGGVASITEDSQARVEGVLYRISWGDLKVMDRYEGVDVALYTRIELPVLSANDTLQAWTYVSRIDDGAPFPTTSDYLNTILRGAREHGLSSDWLAFLKGFPVEDADA